jgi:hypothetical protein
MNCAMSELSPADLASASPLSSTVKWWLTAIGFAAAHFFVLICLFFYCLDNYYDQSSPLDPIVNVLISPVCFLFPLFGESGWALILVPFNSFLWGCLLAEPFRWWFGWAPWRFSLRTLIVVITLTSVLLGAIAALKATPRGLVPPVVQPANH